MTRINRKSFLAEMRSLLAFMDAEDRDRVLRFYEKLFDQAGEEGEGALLKKLGSPVRQVLQVEKLYRNRQQEEELYPAEPVEAAVAEEEEPAAEETSAVEEPAAETADAFSFTVPSEEDAVDFGADEEPEETVEVTEEEPAAEEEEEPEEDLTEDTEAEAEEEAPYAGAVDVNTFAEESDEELAEEAEADEDPAVTETVEFSDETEPAEEKEETVAEEPAAEPKAEKEPVGAGRVVAAVFVTIPMILLVLLGFALSLGLGFSAMGIGVVCGAAGGYLSGYAFGGITAFLPDILLLSGGMLLFFCLALFFLWLGIWLAVGGVRLTIRAVAAVYRGILKRGGQTHE